MKPLILNTLLALVLIAVAQANDFRTFKDSQGREMIAKVTRVSGDEVYIERRDGLSTRVPISLFSTEDQEFIRDWESKNYLKSGIIEIRFSEDESDDSTRSSGGIRSTTYDAGYEVILKNAGDRDVSDIKVEYLIFKFTDRVAAKKRSDGKFERQKGDLELATLKSRSESRLPTKRFSMLETELESGYVWAGGEAGKSPDSKDKLEGIWVKVYVGDMLIIEQARPESLMRNEPW